MADVTEEVRARRAESVRQLHVATARVQTHFSDQSFTLLEENKKIGLKIYRKPDPEYKVDVIRAHVNVKRPLKDIFAVMDDNKGRAAWDKSYALNKSSVLDDWQDPELTRVVWYHDVQGSMLGGIISARDLCNIRYSKMISEDEGLFIFAGAEGDLAVPQTPSVVRAWLFASGLSIKQISPTECAVVYVLQPDPRGHIPSWAVTKAIGQTLADQVNHWTNYQVTN